MSSLAIVSHRPFKTRDLWPLRQKIRLQYRHNSVNICLIDILATVGNHPPTSKPGSTCWRISARTAHETGIPRGLPYLNGYVLHAEIEADTTD